jgi:hypothetical protein
VRRPNGRSIETSGRLVERTPPPRPESSSQMPACLGAADDHEQLSSWANKRASEGTVASSCCARGVCSQGRMKGSALSPLCLAVPGSAVEQTPNRLDRNGRQRPSNDVRVVVAGHGRENRSYGPSGAVLRQIRSPAAVSCRFTASGHPHTSDPDRTRRPKLDRGCWQRSRPMRPALCSSPGATGCGLWTN